MKPTTKKILASIAIIAVVFCSVVTSAFVLNFSIYAYDKMLAALTVIGVIGLSAALFKKL